MNGALNDAQKTDEGGNAWWGNDFFFKFYYFLYFLRFVFTCEETWPQVCKEEKGLNKDINFRFS